MYVKGEYRKEVNMTSKTSKIYGCFLHESKNPIGKAYGSSPIGFLNEQKLILPISLVNKEMCNFENLYLLRKLITSLL